MNHSSAEGVIVGSIDHALSFAHTLGYPVILKPDEGVGAGGIYRVESPEELEVIVPTLPETYMRERFMAAPIVTFDGLTDAAGHVLFENSLVHTLMTISGLNSKKLCTRWIHRQLIFACQRFRRLGSVKRRGP